MPHLEDVRIFAAVIDAGGFRPATQRTGLPASTISDVVRRLEAALGLRLLQRNTRGVMPTDAGRELLRGVGPALVAIEQTIEGLRQAADAPRGRLRLTVPEIVVRYVLPDILTPFAASFPLIDVEVVTDAAVVDIVDGGFDAAIRYAERIDRTMIAVPIGPPRQRYVAAASPAYLARHGVPGEPGDLASHRLIGHPSPGGGLRTWEFRKGRRAKQVTPSGSFVTSSVDLEVAAAVADLGIIYTFDEILRPSLDQGLLQEVLEDWAISFSGPILCYHGDRHVPPPLRAFLTHLRTRDPTPAAR